MIRLHGYAASINVRKVLWLAQELGLGVELVERGTPLAPVDDPAFRSLNPFGMVPCLEDRGRVIAESSTILRYLARRERRFDLLPYDAEGAARVESWLDWQATDLNNSWRYAFMARFRSAPGYDDPGLVEASLRDFSAKVGIIENHLGKTGPFIAGSFTLADIVIGLSIRRWRAFGSELTQFPNIACYCARLSERKPYLDIAGPESAP
jgi:glutathione S-transferase